MTKLSIECTTSPGVHERDGVPDGIPSTTPSSSELVCALAPQRSGRGSNDAVKREYSHGVELESPS